MGEVWVGEEGRGCPRAPDQPYKPSPACLAPERVATLPHRCPSTGHSPRKSTPEGHRLVLGPPGADALPLHLQSRFPGAPP